MATTLGQKSVGNVVKLNLNGTPWEFIIVHHGNPDAEKYDASCNGTWLLLKDIYGQHVWDSQNSNSYGDSDIHDYLNSTFLGLFDADIQSAIKQVKMRYVNRYGVVVSGENGLSCKIFLLSSFEAGGLSPIDVVSGEKLDYFLYNTEDGAKERRIAKYNGRSHNWACRSIIDGSHTDVVFISSSGDVGHSDASDTDYGVRPALIMPDNLMVSDDGTVSVNQPPTAPGSITVTNVAKGQQATITLTSATDSDGTVVNYIYERLVDGGTWSQFASANSLTQTDTIGSGWGTVAYRAKAVDDDGAEGPYATSTTETVNSGMLIIDGPDDVLGDKPIPFSFEFELGTSDQTSVTGIDVSVTLDGESLYTGARDTGVSNILYLDTRLLSAGTHTLQVDASKEDYLPASATYTFNVPAITLPDGGKAEQPQNSNGDTVWWYGLARYIIGEGGKDLNAITKELREAVKSAPKFAYGSYMGTGTYGASNPTTITCGFKPSLAFIFDDIGSVSQSAWESLLVWCGQSQDAYYGLHFESDGTSLSWYSTINANCQWNISGNTAYYAIIGFDE